MFEIVVGLFIGTIFTLIFGYIIFLSIKGLREWSRNNKLPIKSIRTTVIAKNSETSYTSDSGDNSHSSSSTTRTITFQNLVDNSRYVFQVNRQVYDLTIEGDVGILVHQGTRFHRFEVG